MPFLLVISAEVSCSDPLCVADAAGARQGDARTASLAQLHPVRDGDGRVWLRERRAAAPTYEHDAGTFL